MSFSEDRQREVHEFNQVSKRLQVESTKQDPSKVVALPRTF